MTFSFAIIYVALQLTPCYGQLNLPFLQPNEPAPRIYDGPKSQAVMPGGAATFKCGVSKFDLAQRLIWSYLDHGLVLSINKTLLTLDKRYQILENLGENGTVHYDLQIKNVATEDAGTYSCQVFYGSGGRLIQTAVLTVNGSSSSVLPSVGIQSTMLFERQECCRRMNVSTSCQKLCSGQSSWSAYDIVNSVQCMSYLGTFVYCASDQRNHVPCCIRRFVAADCLDFCAPPAGPNMQGFGLGRVASLSLRCFPQLASITRCMEEGQHTIPDPPRGVSLTPLSPNSLLVRWIPPSTTGFYSEDNMKYRVFVASVTSDDNDFTDNDFQITPGLTDNEEMILNGLNAATRYAVYVTALSAHGSSAPSFIADVYTPPVIRPTESDSASIKDCCSKAKVPNDCADLLCSAKHSPEQLQNISNGNVAFTCANSLQSAFRCLSGKFDHQTCCRTRRIPSNCLTYCSPKAPPFGIEHASCLRYIGLMNACFMEGKHLFPGAVSNFTLENVTATSATLEWSPPLDNAAVVVRYKVIIKPFINMPSDDEENQWQAIPTQSTRIVVSGLDPDQPYTASVWAESSFGPGLTSIIDFATLAMIQDSNSTNMAPDMGSCCSILGVKSECMKYCNTDVFANTSAAAAADPVLFYSCLNADFHKVLACAADGRNHSLCCARQGIPAPCLRVCAVSSHFRDIGRDQAMCVSFSQTIVQCLREGWTTIPKPPRSLDVYNITAHSAVLSWRPPPSDSPILTSYMISAWTIADDDRVETEISMPVVSKAAFYEKTITGLTARSKYNFRVFSVNSGGRSLASNEISLITAPDDSINETAASTTPSIPFSAWANNMSACCTSLRLSSACSAACSDVRALSVSYCPDDIPQLLTCWSSADTSPEATKSNAQCCYDAGVPSNCANLCTSSASQIRSISQICVSTMPLVLSCYQRRFASIPSAPRRLSVVSTSALSAILRWLPPSRNAENLSSYTLFYFAEPNNTDIQSVANISAALPSSYPSLIDDDDDPGAVSTMIDPGMMTYTLGDLRPSTLYRVWIVALSNTSAVSLPSAEVTFATARESLYVTMLLQPGEYAPAGKPFSMLCSPQFAFSNVTWWYSPPGPLSDLYSIRQAGLLGTTTPATSGISRIQIPTPSSKATNLTINPMLANSSGQYTCRVMSNFSKNYYESTRFVKVMTQPVAVNPFTKLTLSTRYYSTIPVNCSFTGYPVSFRWYQGSVPFRSFPRTSFVGNSSVSIIQVLASTIESTVFTCNASNLFGSVTCEVAVDFIRPAVPTVTPTISPWLPTNQPSDASMITVDISSLSAMVDADCCLRAIRRTDGCQCPQQTPIASRTMNLPQRCLLAMQESQCASVDSLPSAPRELKVTLGAYSSNASWVPPLKSSYLSRFKVVYSSPLDPRSPFISYAEMGGKDSNLFWSSRAQSTFIARLEHNITGLLPTVTYRLTVTSLNVYNFSDSVNGYMSLDVAPRLPSNDEPLPVVAVTISRTASVFAVIQWSIRAPAAYGSSLTDSNSQIEVCYRAAPNFDEEEKFETSFDSEFYRVKADSKSRQVTIPLNASTDYYVVVLASIMFDNKPMIIGSSPMLLSNIDNLNSMYASAYGGELAVMNQRYVSVRNLAVGFGITLLMIVLIAAGLGIFFLVKYRRRHLDQMRHVRLARTVSFENRANSDTPNSGQANQGMEADNGYDIIGNPDASQIKIQPPPDAPQQPSGRTHFEISNSPNIF